MRGRNLLIVIGVILILFNALSYMSGETNPPEKEINKTAYFIGRNIFFIAAVLFLIIAYYRHKKIIRKKDKEMINNFLN